MSDKIKMSELGVFKVPVFVTGKTIGHQWGDYAKFTSEIQAKAAAHAIDNHDRLTQENARLTELAAQKASRCDEFYEMLSALSNDYAELLDKSIDYIGSHGASTHAQVKILLSKINNEGSDNE